MGDYSKLRNTARAGKYGCKAYAAGGRVDAVKRGAKTIININTAPASGGVPMPAPMAAPPSPAGPPVPPAAAGMALSALQGKPGAPGAFKRGGRVMAGAESGVGRLQNTKAQKKVSKAPGKPAPGGKRP